LIDGGVVDNLPWFPFIEDNACEQIVIVGCNPRATWKGQKTDEEMKKTWKDRNRLVKIIKSNL
jgi:predicted patatin/cPLA2 family phospholipase